MIVSYCPFAVDGNCEYYNDHRKKHSSINPKNVIQREKHYINSHCMVLEKGENCAFLDSINLLEGINEKQDVLLQKLERLAIQNP